MYDGICRTMVLIGVLINFHTNAPDTFEICIPRCFTAMFHDLNFTCVPETFTCKRGFLYLFLFICVSKV